MVEMLSGVLAGAGMLSGVNSWNTVPGTDANYDNLVSTYESRVNAARKQLQSYINYIDQEET